jgi:hypothetical protein
MRRDWQRTTIETIALGLVAVGISMVSVPAALVAIGGLVLVASVAGRRGGGR